MGTELLARGCEIGGGIDSGSLAAVMIAREKKMAQIH